MFIGSCTDDDDKLIEALNRIESKHGLNPIPGSPGMFDDDDDCDFENENIEE